MSTFEYRKLLRASVVLKVTYRTVKKPVFQETVFSKNISCVSIAIINTRIFQKDTEVLLEIYPSAHQQPILAKGRVKWQSKCSYTPKSGRQFYVTVVVFSEMLPDDVIRTSDFVKDILLQRSQEEETRIIDKIEEMANGI